MRHWTKHPLGTLTVTAAILGMATTPMAAQTGALDRLSVHGFLSQAYGASDHYQVAGIPSHGTADYRVAALQFRYDATDRDVFVIQFSHERLGLSPLAAYEPEVDVDWIFYEHRLGDRTIARVGKIKSPIGMYNQIRDVGTLLPLYRPPEALYNERTYSNETVDGVLIGHQVPLGAWGLDIEGFFGSWEYFQWDRQTRAHVDNALGGQLWLSTPIEGLRLGAAAIRSEVRNLQDVPEDLVDTQVIWFTALDGTFSRFFVRGEGFSINLEEEGLPYAGDALAYYGQVGLHISDVLSVVAQAERRTLALDFFGPQPFSFDGTADRDISIGVRFQPSPNLAFKLEGHSYRGFGTDDPALVPGRDDPVSLSYGLVSVSTSF